jgi:hypothetical protein
MTVPPVLPLRRFTLGSNNDEIVGAATVPMTMPTTPAITLGYLQHGVP